MSQAVSAEHRAHIATARCGLLITCGSSSTTWMGFDGRLLTRAIMFLQSHTHIDQGVRAHCVDVADDVDGEEAGGGL